MQEYIVFFQQNMILSLIWAVLLIAVIVTSIKSATAKYKTITPAQATDLINRQNGVVIDLRSKDEFKVGHITDAKNLTIADIKANQVSALYQDKSTAIILVCKTGQTSVEAANLLIKEGFENVNLLKNGISGWMEASLPLVRSTNKK